MQESPVQWLLTGILNEWVFSKLISNHVVQFESPYIVHVKIYLKVIQKIMLKKKEGKLGTLLDEETVHSLSNNTVGPAWFNLAYKLTC